MNKEALKWFEESEYIYDLEDHDEGGYLGINEHTVSDMLNDYFRYKTKQSYKSLRWPKFKL